MKEKEKSDVFINLDGQKYKKKKLCPNDALKFIRIQLNLSDNIIFQSEDGYPIDVEDEAETLLKDILQEQGKSFLLALKTNKENFISINVYLNNKKIHDGFFPDSIIMKDLIKNYENKLPFNAILYSNGYPTEINDYKDILVKDILENNSLYYRTEEYKKKNTIKKDIRNIINKIDSDNEEEEKSLEYSLEKEENKDNGKQIFIKIGKETRVRRYCLSEKLNNIREKLKEDLHYKFKFLTKGIPIEENEEFKWMVNDILIKENDEFVMYIENCEIQNNKINENINKNIKFFDYSNEKLLFKNKFDINQDLESIREKISKKFNKNFKFMKRRKEIEEDEEPDYLLKNIIKDNIAILKIIDNNGIENPFLKFKLNGRELFANRINTNLSLFEVRRNFSLIPNEAKFLKDGYNVNDERGTIIGDIITDNEYIYLQNEEEDKKTAPPPAKKEEEMSIYRIFIDNKFLRFFKTKEKTTLDEIRTALITQISEQDHFVYLEKGETQEIPIETEDQWTLKDYCNDNNKIYINKKKNIQPEKKETKKPSNEIDLNKPIKDSKKISENNNLSIYEYPSYPFNENEKIGIKTIMVVGETGSGKTTLLNSFLNYLMGIKFEDNFRYKIIVEDTKNKKKGDSITDNVNIYYIRTNIPEIPYVRIVDTPGFGDTRGISYDKGIIDMIEYTFKNKCDTINAICFVLKSNETRLTDFQKYIFAQVMSIFGNDVGENFIAMLTFSDGQVPNIVSCLENKDSIFYQVKEQIQDPWYLTFNNSAVFCDVPQRFTKTFWDLAMDSYRSFVGKLKVLPDKSCYLTSEVLRLRKQLETTIIGLRPQIDKSLGIMENMRKEIAFVRANKDKIDQFKDFNYKYKEPVVTQKNLKQGEYTSNCIICNYTCHYPCYIPDNNKKMRCSAMKNGICTVCKNKCNWDQHKNLNYIFEYTEVEKIKTSEDLRNEYVKSNSKLKQSEQILKGLESEFCEILKECYKNAGEINKCIEGLKKNALTKNPNENFNNYIKNCILKEEQEKKPGYLDRIKGYQMLKDTNDKIIKAFKGQNIYEDMDKFKEYILKEKEEIFKMYEKERDSNEKDKPCIIF